MIKVKAKVKKKKLMLKYNSPKGDIKKKKKKIIIIIIINQISIPMNMFLYMEI